MATFIALINFTEQGIRNIQDSPKRADAFRKAAEKAGGSVRDVYWTLGAHDGVLIIDAPDDETAAAILVGLGKLGNARTTTLRAFGGEEIGRILKKVK